MKDTVQKIFTHGKGVLALDWSPGTIKKQFKKVGLKSTPELNRIYRQMLLTSPNINLFVSGVILHDQTISQKMDSGKSFVDYLNELGIAPGARADIGGDYFSGSKQKMTEGLGGIEDRFKLYSQMGIKFTKWRAAFKISDTYPTDSFLEESIKRLVEFAKISHKYSLVPFVEPDVLIKGEHTTTRCADISAKVLKKLFSRLKKEKVDIKNVILKTNMVLPGVDSGVVASPLEVANATLRVFRDSLPNTLPGVVFLSGGQSYDDSVEYLDKIVDLSKEDKWDLSFSYARSLQKDALRQWSGKKENIEKAQKVLLTRLEKATRAREGEL